jgi:hypothetical protein
MEYDVMSLWGGMEYDVMSRSGRGGGGWRGIFSTPLSNKSSILGPYPINIF